MPSDFERKVEIVELVGDRERPVTELIAESEVRPVFVEDPQPDPGPVPGTTIHEKPDPSALRDWVDDLGEFQEQHVGDAELFDKAEKLREVLADDLIAEERRQALASITAADEQEGLVGNFLADSAIEGAALATPPRGGDDMIVKVAGRRSYLDDEYGGGGGGPPGGGPPPGGDGRPADDDDAAPAGPDDPEDGARDRGADKRGDKDKDKGKGKGKGKDEAPAPPDRAPGAAKSKRKP